MTDDIGIIAPTGVKDTSHLKQQNLATLEVEKLTPLTPEVISRQATINIGTIGHVAHGKSTVVRAISGVQPVRFKAELERNITIKLGYANAKIYKCTNPECPAPDCYRSYGSMKEDSPLCERIGCGGRMKLLRHISFVDCPGHDILMATMINGAAVMDAALLLIAGNEDCPQPQTSEHLAAVEIMKLQTIIVLQNKVDLITKERSIEQYKAIKDFLQGTSAGNSPVIPISAQLKYNIDAVLECIVKTVPVPRRNFLAPSRLIVIRSFDINKPGCTISKLQGGVAGGSILQGVIRLNDEIEIRPGLVVKGETSSSCTFLKTRVVSLFAEEIDLQYAVPGGLIGVGTNVDPTLCKADRLVGQILGRGDSLPDVFSEIEITCFLLRRLLGVRDDAANTKVAKLDRGEMLMVNIGSTSTGGRVLGVAKDIAKLQLMQPVCTEKNQNIALSRKIDKHWRLIGWGTVIDGTKFSTEKQ